MVGLFVAMFLFITGGSQPNTVSYLQNVLNHFSGIKDYTVDVRVHFDVRDFQAPDMEATVYYKEPDKVRIKSKGLFILPRQVGLFNPRQFNPNDYDVRLIDTLTLNADPCVRVSLTPKNKRRKDREIILTIDKKDWLVREISTPPSQGKNVTARITYGSFNGFELPSEMNVDIDVNNANVNIPEIGRDHKPMNSISGSVQIYYSNYEINTGLSDKIFENHGADR